MSTTPDEPVTPSTPTPPTAQPESPKTDPAPTDWVAEARKWEQRAKDNKAAADELAALKESSKSELQKALDRAAKAEKEAADLKAAAKAAEDEAAHKAQVKTWAEAAAKPLGIPADALKGNTEAEIKAHAALLASLLPRKGHVPTEGTRPAGDGNSEMREFARQLFHRD